MALFFHTSAVPHTQDPLQIIQYSGPPKPKQASRRNPSEAPPSNDSPRSDTELDAELDNKEDPVPTSCRVEVIDLTCLVGEGTSEIRGGGGGGEGDVGSYDDFALKNEIEDEDFEQTLRDGIEDESLNRPATYENSCQEHTIVIEHIHPRSDTDEGDLHEDYAGTQTGDRREASSISALEYFGWAYPTDTGSVISHDAVDEVKTQLSGPTSREFPLEPPTSSSKVDIGQSSRGKVLTNEDTSRSSSSDADNSDENAHGNQTAPPTCKRKRCPSTTRHIRSSDMTSKQYAKKATHSTKQGKRSSAGGNPLSNHPLAPTHRQAPPCSRHDAKECYSDDSGDDSIEDHVRHLESDERPTSNVPLSRSRKHKLKRNGGAGDKDDEYEVERILNARSSRKKLQYRVKWLGYKDDPIWYDASNFKNSPFKVRDFHLLNPTRPGPPKRLKRWIQCWEDDSDTDDHPDDNKPV